MARLQPDEALQWRGEVQLHLTDLAVEGIIVELDITGEVLGVFPLVVERIFRSLIEQDLVITMRSREITFGALTCSTLSRGDTEYWPSFLTLRLALLSVRLRSVLGVLTKTMLGTQTGGPCGD